MAAHELHGEARLQQVPPTPTATPTPTLTKVLDYYTGNQIAPTGFHWAGTF